MRANHLLIGVITLVVAGSSTLAVPQPPRDEALERQASQAEPLSFLRYKRLFNKHYASIIEETARAKYFTARALRAFGSAIGFQFRFENYFLSLNHLSDQSPAELEMMENHLWADLDDSELVTSRPTASAEATLQDSGTEEGDLPREIPSVRENDDSDPKDSLDQQLAKSLGRMTKQVAQPRRLPASKLINTGAGAKLSPEAQAKVVAHVPSDNPLYAGIELPTQGLVDQQLPVDWYEIDPPAREPTNPVEQLGRFLGGVGENIMRTLNPALARQQDREREKAKRELVDAEWARAKQQKEEEQEENLAAADEVFVDLRTTNCLFLPRNQGRCGSCYAFAAITVMEFLRCRQTGKLVAMSEQYMVDCGTQFVDHLDGCRGGSPKALPVFVRNFGMHLRNQYPYRARVDQCPYDESTDPRQTGYLRPRDFSSSVRVPIELWPEALKHGPLLVGIATGPAFREFGGGVYSGKQCPPKATHAVLIVGHGRADNNREYWLVRNSHGPGWGEQGYMRLDKESDCIHPAAGYAFGVRDPKFLGEVHFAENELHTPESLATKLPKAEQIKSQFNNQARGFGGQAAAAP